MGRRLLEVVVLGLLVSVVCVGCPKKPKGPQAGAGSGLGEEGLAGGGS